MASKEMSSTANKEINDIQGFFDAVKEQGTDQLVASKTGHIGTTFVGACAQGTIIFELPDEMGKDDFVQLCTTILDEQKCVAYGIISETFMSMLERADPDIERIQNDELSVSELDPSKVRDALMIHVEDFRGKSMFSLDFINTKDGCLELESIPMEKGNPCLQGRFVGLFNKIDSTSRRLN